MALTRRLSSLLLPSSSLFIPSQSIWSPRSRKTGRVCGNAIMPSKAWRYDISRKRIYSRMEGMRYGYDVGLEDRVVLASLSGRNRRLDEKKMRQLAEIFELRLTEIISANEILAAYKLSFSKVKVNPGFSEIVVWWMANGEKDEEISECLERERHSIRRQLAVVLSTTVPEINFKADKTELRLKEMDELFKRADYGMDYRALSETARVLGRVENEKEGEDRQKPLSEWKRRLEKRKEEAGES